MKQRWTRWLLSAALAMAGCQAPGAMPAGMAPQAAMTLEATRAVDALGDRPNALWQDALFTNRAVQERRKTSRYRVAAVTAGNTWGAPATLPAASTNGVAYAHHDTSFGDQPPGPNDVVWVACDNGQVVRLRATTGAVMGTPYAALAGLAGPGTITRSAIALSGKNDRVYLLTSGGYFVMLDAATGTRLAAVKVSNAGFANIAPYIDYSNGGGTPGQFNDEYLYALAADGSLYQFRVNGNVTVRGWRAVGGADSALGAGFVGAPTGTVTVTNGGLAAVLAYGNVRPARCKASPIVWNGQAFFGGDDGRFYRVRTAAGALDAIPVSTYGIETTPAINFDDNLNVTQAFVPAGDRLHWIDPTAAAGLTRVAISPPLVLNAKPTSASVGASGLLSNYTYAGLTDVLAATTATDWVATATASVPGVQGPTRWGGGAQDLGAIDTVNPPYEVKVAPDGKIWFTNPANDRIRKADPLTLGVTDTFNGDGNFASFVQTIPVAARPTGLTKDPLTGGVWVSCYGADSISQINAAGVVVRTITGVPSPTGLAYDQRGTVGNVTDDVIWVCSTTGSMAGATGALIKVQLSNGAITSYTNAHTAATARTWNSVGGTPANNTALTSANWAFRGPQGVVVAGDGNVWVANSLQNMRLGVGNSGRPAAYPFDFDGTGSGANQDGVNNDNSSLLVFNPASSQFTARIICTGAPYGMAFSSQTTLGVNVGSVWVGTYRWGRDVVERYDQNLGAQYVRRFVSIQTGNHWQPRWVAVDDANNRMWVVNGNSEGTATVATNGLDAVRANALGTSSMAGALPFIGTYPTGTQPRGVDVDSTGSVWVANSTATTVTRYSGTGAPLGNYPVGNQPYAVVTDKFDVAWVANQADNTVSRIEGSTLPPVTLDEPRGFDFDAANNVWIANAGNDSMTVMNQTGNIVLPKIDTNSQPWGVAAAGTQIFVASNNSRDSVRINRTTGVVTDVDLSNGDEAMWVAANSAGGAYFSVPGSDELKRVTAAGGVTNVPGFDDPRGIAVNPANDDTWVADSDDDQILRYAGAPGVGALTTINVDDEPLGVAVKGNQAWASSVGLDRVTRINAVDGGGRVGVGTLLGTITGFAAADNPTQMAIDAYDNVWVANTGASRIRKIWHAGAQDLLAAQHYRAADGVGSYAYLRFPITAGMFNGRTPVSARIQLTTSSNSARTTETIHTLGARTALSGTTAWAGYAGTPSVDWNARPALVAGATASGAAAMTNGNSYWFPAKVFSEVHDASTGPWDLVNGAVTYAFQAAGVNLADVAHIATSTALNRPKLEVTVTRTKLPASGLRSQPTVDDWNKRVYVMGTNAVFELRFDTPENFANPAMIAYSFSQSGVAVGPLQTATDYVVPTGASTLTYGGKLVTVDYSPSTNQTALNAYAINLFGAAPFGGFYLNPSGNNSAQLTTTATIAGQLANSQLTYDYDRGSVYLVNGTQVVGIKLLQ
ncbi:MAG: hypothetical protein ACK46X_08160 [Candidatus Sericytochromatia bacterium]